MAIFLLFLAVFIALLCGYPVALTLAGISLLAALAGIPGGHFDASLLTALPNRIFGIMNNTTLIAVPLFVFMGVMLQQSRVAETLLQDLGVLFRRLPGGGLLAVVAVGALLAASTGIIGATVVTMGLLALPALMRQGYSPPVSAGSICAVGTLGQIIPPSIALVLLGDVLSGAYQQAQLQQGIFSPRTVSVGELFMGALLPGLLLVLLYAAYILLYFSFRPQAGGGAAEGRDLHPGRLLLRLAPPLLLIITVLGSILAGIATPTEAAGVGALGAALLAAGNGRLQRRVVQEVGRTTLEISCMVFLIMIAATVFSLVFRGFGGDELVQQWFASLPGGLTGAMVAVMVVMFLLGFVLDFIEITFVVTPIVAPVLLMMGADPVWLGVMIAVNLQTSFLTPPFGFALFYLRGVAPPELGTAALYRGVLPFVGIQLLLLLLLAQWPLLATWLPGALK